MLSLKDYGSSSEEEGPSEPTTDSTISVHELSKQFAVNAAPEVLPPVCFQIMYYNHYLVLINV